MQFCASMPLSPRFTPLFCPRTSLKSLMINGLKALWKGYASEQLERALQESNRGRGIALDFDNTCIVGDTGELLHLHLSENLAWDLHSFAAQIAPEDGQATLLRLIEAYEAGDDVHDELTEELILAFPRRLRRTGAPATYAWATGLHAGTDVFDLRHRALLMLTHEAEQERTRQEIAPGKPEALSIWRGLRSRPALESLVRAAEIQGLSPWIISATNEWTVAMAASDFGIPPERVIGNRSLVRDDIILAERDSPVTWRHGKVQAYERYVSSTERPALAVGDSWTDFELLEFADDAILIDRGDERLQQEAASRGWGIVPADVLDTVKWGTLRRQRAEKDTR